MTFEWDGAKRAANLEKHAIEFADAVGVFQDPLARTMADEGSGDEDRFVTMGSDFLGRILVVIYTWRGDAIRLISARKATRRERAQYGE